ALLRFTEEGMPTSSLVPVLAGYLGGMTWLAWLLVIPTLYFSPDAVTFLIWEMKGNWKLYRANRSATVKPAAVGPHGESAPTLLRPGFHSGTVPHLYAKLRAAERQAITAGHWRAVRTCRQQIKEGQPAGRRGVAPRHC